MSDFVHALRGRTRGEVRADDVSRALYATDASLYEVRPLAVLRAEEPGDLVAAAETCREHGVPITARGAGTSLAGQAVGPGLVIDFRKMNGVAWIQPEEDPHARVGPGVVLDSLNARAEPHGLWFGPDTATSSRCTIGGMIGNNSCGARSLWYGMTVDHVRALDVVLAGGARVRLDAGDGAPPAAEASALRDRVGAVLATVREDVREQYATIPRRASGYNLDRMLERPEAGLVPLIVGSEGTLALVEAAEVRLVPRPPAITAAAMHFSSIDAALECARDLGAAGPLAVELIDRTILDLARASREFSRFLGWVEGEPDAVLLVEFAAGEARAAASRMESAARDAAARFRAKTVVLAEGDRDHAWRVRKAGLPLLYSLEQARRPLAFVEDTAVPPERLPEFVREFRSIVERAGTTAAFYAHAAAGCLHVRPLLDVAHAPDLAALTAIQRDVAALVREFGGAMSGEHGDGRVRSHLLESFFGERIVRAFGAVKAVFDPGGLMNPGVIVDPADPTLDLRAPARAVRARLDHGPLGLAEATGRCFGAGVCLKTSGAMCPSFMATEAEDDSTRARANALRSVMAGTLPAESLAGARMREVMDLCVGCKACKAECPAGVDVARLKVEWLAGLRPSMRARVLAATPALARAGSLFPRAANALASSAAGRTLARRLGLEGAAPPLLATRLSKWHARRPPREGPPIRVFADTFSEHFDDAPGRAAVLVLEAAGYRVELIAGVCCGRTAISQGRLDRARRSARRARRALGEGTVVFMEPSCWSAVVDDWPALGVPPPGAECVTFDQFAQRERSSLERLVRADRGDALVHVHCHERALRGLQAGAAAAAIPAVARVVDAGCCGMAGSFGYEREHDEVSRRMGERVLAPAVRGARGAVVSAGFSCRSQIERLTGVRAVHPAELLARSADLDTT